MTCGFIAFGLSAFRVRSGNFAGRFALMDWYFQHVVSVFAVVEKQNKLLA